MPLYELEDPNAVAARVWGKTIPAHKPLIHHLIDAGMVAKLLMEEGGFACVSRHMASLLHASEQRVIAFAAHFVALHDVGKAHGCFQMKAPDLSLVQALTQANLIPPAGAGDGYAHEAGTKQALRRTLEIGVPPGARKRSILIAALCDAAGSHHYRFEFPAGAMTERLEAYWHGVQDALVRQIETLFPVDWAIATNCAHIDALCTQLWGLTVLSDWIASGQEVFFQGGDASPMAYAKEAPRLAREAIHLCGLQAPARVQSPTDFCAYWNFTDARPLQRRIERLVVEENIPLLSIIEAPMGEGKTEAALYLAAHMAKAYDKDGFYIAMPTAATSNQMHGRVQEMLARQGTPHTRLLHAMAWLIDEESVEAARGLTAEDDAQTDGHEQGFVDWLRPLRRGMLECFAVGTVDQAMMAALKARFGVLRLLGLSAKVLVIDEMHAYDAYMLSILLRLMQWCAALRVPVIILSATLPVSRRDALIAAYRGALEASPSGDVASEGDQLITSLSPNNVLTRIGISGAHATREVGIRWARILGDAEAIASEALEGVKDDGCLCVLLNTVREAQEVYLRLRDRPEAGEALLFHAGFSARRRKEIEEAIVSRFGKSAGTNRPRRAIVVATQVLEQSLDVDFDAMITAIAPVDLLLQRVGRVFRHDETLRRGIRSASLVILVPNGTDYGDTGYVYFHHVLNVTRDVLAGRDRIALPGDIRTLVERVYNACPDPEDSQAYSDWFRMVYSQELNVSKAKAHELPEPNPDRFLGSSIGMTHTYDEEGRVGYRVVRTRLGEDSIFVALVSIQEAQALAKRKPTRKQAIDLWQRSFSMQAGLLGDAAPGEPIDVQGLGLCKGLVLLPSADGMSVRRKTQRGMARLLYDDELGRSMEKQ